MEKKRNVFRIDTGGTHGWQVRICRNGTWHRKLFSDSKFESKEAAYKAAVAHRNEMLDELPDLPGDEDDELGHLHTEEVNDRRWEAVTRTGVKGLGFTMQQYSRATTDKRPYISVHWTEDGRRRATSYSVVKHGFDGALRHAASTLSRNTDHDLTVEEMIETARPRLSNLLDAARVSDVAQGNGA